MKLFELKRGTKFRLVSKDPITPPDAQLLEWGDVLTLDHVDGMFSFCRDREDNVVHPAAFSDVEEVG